MQQYFIKGQPMNEPFSIQDKDTVKHMFQVMRLSNGDQFIAVFDNALKYKMTVVDQEAHVVRILEEYEEMTELPVDVTIAMGFPKGDKLDFLAQKVTELGASQLWAYPADWSVVKWDSKKLNKKSEKLKKIAQGAAEQSKRHKIPEIQLFATQKTFMDAFSEFDIILVAYEESAKQGETSAFSKTLAQIEKGQRILIICGPEGGISLEEIVAYKEKGAQLIGLGPRIMRTETAPLYALSTISYHFELAD